MMHAFFKSVPFLIGSFLPILVTAQAGLQWGEPIVVHSGAQDQARPRIVLNGDQKPVILWGQVSPAANFVSVGEGGSFSPAQLLHPIDMHPAVADWQGSDLIANGNMIHAVMKMTPENTGGTYLVSSSDGGYTWSDTLRVDQVPGYKTRFSSIAVNAAGEPLIQFMRIDLAETEHRNMVSRVIDGVVQPPVDVSSPFTAGDDCDCCPGQIIANGDQAVALFRDATNDQRVIWGASSINGGSSFEQGAQLDPTNWQLNICPASGPDGVFSGDSLCYVWMSGAVNGSKIYFGKAGTSDLNAAPVIQVHPGQPQNIAQDHPRISGSADTIGVVWQQTALAQTEVLFSWRTDSDAFSVPDTINVDMAGPQRSPDIVFANGTFHITWADYQQNTIMYRAASLVNMIGIEDLATVPVLQVWPVPATDLLHIPFQQEWGGSNYTIVDALGHTVMSGRLEPQIAIEELAVGSYTLIVQDRSEKQVAMARFTVAR